MSDQPENSGTTSDNHSEFHGTRSWRGYLFEFILLFMAVFLGFVAENFREELSERERAEELANNFYDELLADSIAIRWYIDARFQKDSALVALKKYAIDSSLTKISRTFVKNYYVGLFMNYRFEPTDVVLEQLKNSGSLIYFKNKELHRLTGGLEDCITQMRQGDEADDSFIQELIIPFHVEHGDQLFYDKIISGHSEDFGSFIENLSNDSTKADYHINNQSGFSREKFNNMVGLFRERLRGHTLHHYLKYQKINQQLLSLLRKEYEIN